MRTNNKILKIRHSNFPNIAFISGNGEYRTIDIKKHFKKLHLSDNDFGYEVLKDKELFKTVTVEDNALAWKQLNTTMKLPSGKTFTAFFHLDPLQTIQNSEPETPEANYQIGYKIKEERLSQNLSQDELAYKIGTSKHYISKIENAKTDFEFKTLQKIFEVGLGKKVHVSIYSRVNSVKDISNSVLSHACIEWLNQKRDEMTLIAGIGQQQLNFFKKYSITTPLALSKLEFVELLEFLKSEKKSVDSFKHIETWILQAKYINNGDWIGLIALQKTQNGNRSLAETMVKAALGEGIYGIEDRES